MPARRNRTRSQKKPASRGQIVVLGMHRSGTSCVGNLLTRLGVYFGDAAVSTGAAPENPKGFFERRDVRELCDTILHGSGCDWWAVNDFSPERVPAAVRAEVSERFADVLKDLEAHRPWFIKEPRLCLTFSLLAQQVADPVFVLVWRRPVEVAQSLATRNGFPVDFGLALWEAYVRAALAISRGKPTVIMSYNDLVADPHTQAARLVQALRDLGVDGVTLPGRAEVENAVDPQLHRNRNEPRHLVDLLTPSQQRLVEALASGKPGHPAFDEPLSAAAQLRIADWARREGVVIELRRAARDGTRTVQQVARLETEIDSRDRKIAKLNEQLAERDRAGASLKRELSQALDQRRQAQEAVRVLERSRQQWDAERLRLTAQVAQRTAARAEIEAALARERAAHRKTAAQVKKVEAGQAKQADALARREARIAALKHDLRRTDAWLDKLKLHLRALEERIEREAAQRIERAETEQAIMAAQAQALKAGGGAALRALVQGAAARAGARQGLSARKLALYAHYGLRGRRDVADVVAVAASGLFDADYYRRQNPDVAAAGLDPLLHYVDFGAAEGRNPSALFDTRYYVKCNPDVASSGLNPLFHFVAHGRREGRLPRPIQSRRLSPKAWQLPPSPKAKAAEGAQSVAPPSAVLQSSHSDPNATEHEHTLTYLPPVEANDTPSRQDTTTNGALIRGSELFDKAWYLAEYSDVAHRRADPIGHYLRHGAAEMRDPGPAFSTAWYLQKYPDVRASGMNPLVHYLRHGRAEGRLPRPRPEQEAWWSTLVPVYSERIADTADRAKPALDPAAAITRMARNPAPPAVIVPIYNAADELEDCLSALIRHSGHSCRIILIDDASPDARIATILARYAQTPSVEIHRNETNLGFTRTINKGIELAGRADVILLNSDTKVTPGWLRNLRIAAYSGEKVGTATPFSNNAGAFSAPEIGQSNEIPPWLSLDEYARAIAQVSQRLYPRTPTGNGFCMYVRRDCIDETGLFDAEAFPRGYGEENDFCMRAGRLGWSHVIDDATLIWHARSASFGEEKSDLMKRGRAEVDARYPGYTESVRRFVADEGLRAARERIRRAADAVTPQKTGVRPRVLFVLSTRTGGTPQTNQDLMSALDDRVEAFVLRCSSSTITLMYFRDGTYVDMERHTLAAPLTAFPHRSAEYDAVVADWLVRYAIELVHIRHIAWHGLGLVDTAKAIGLPIVFSFHDFYAVCPTVKLLDEANVYCGGKCTPTKGECQHELWLERDFPPLKHAAIATWREQLGPVLQQCDAFVTTSASAKKTLTETYPFLAERVFPIISHGRDFEMFDRLAKTIKGNEVIRVLIPGNISVAKGLDVIAQLAKYSATDNVELHVLGRIASKVSLPATVIVHGAYDREEFAERARSIHPHIGAVLSIWPETYCHTLTELWSCGLPVIGFDYGAVGERIRETGAGWLTAEPTAAGAIDIIRRLRADPEEQLEKIAAVVAWQKGPAIRDNCQRMGEAYFDLYRSLVDGQTRFEASTKIAKAISLRAEVQ